MGTQLAGVWEANDVRPGGEATIVELLGMGGALEGSQPLPTGAVRLTTDFSNPAKAEIGVFNNYGLAGDIIPSLQLAYDFFKASNPGQNIFAAPSLKLAFFNPSCDDPVSMGDCFGELVWEFYLQGNGNPPLDTWTSASIDSNNSGLFWWTGGFGQPNDAGGPASYTLAGFLSAASSDFPDAQLIRVSVGVGSFNQGQIGYFDNVSIRHSFEAGFDEIYDFELTSPSTAIAVPLLHPWALFLLMPLLGFVAFRVLGEK